jgi:hypothetical protein
MTRPREAALIARNRARRAAAAASRYGKRIEAIPTAATAAVDDATRAAMEFLGRLQRAPPYREEPDAAAAPAADSAKGSLTRTPFVGVAARMRPPEDYARSLEEFICGDGLFGRVLHGNALVSVAQAADVRWYSSSPPLALSHLSLLLSLAC